jgi:hypothetical protein
VSAPPYSWLSNPAQFGFAADPDWRSAPKGQEWALAAAEQQHVLAYAVREWKRVNRKSDKHLAAALGVHPETIGRYLRGELTLDLNTFNRLAQEAGLFPTVTLLTSGDPSTVRPSSRARTGGRDT